MDELQWLGAAGFWVSIHGHSVLIDPFIFSEEDSLPEEPRGVEDLERVEAIFLTHGHFDHSQDIPQILDLNQTALLYCSETMKRYFTKKGVSAHRIVAMRGGSRCIFDKFTVEAFPSRHIRFDLKLVVATLLRIQWDIFDILPLVFYPCGEVLSYRFVSESMSFHHFGSAGSTDEELDKLSRFPLDVLLLPLQGHTRILDLAFRYVEKLKPRCLIPQHHDDFFPPISQKVDIGPFIKQVHLKFPRIEVRELPVNGKTAF